MNSIYNIEFFLSDKYHGKLDETERIQLPMKVKVTIKYSAEVGETEFCYRMNEHLLSYPSWDSKTSYISKCNNPTIAIAEVVSCLKVILEIHTNVFNTSDYNDIFALLYSLVYNEGFRKTILKQRDFDPGILIDEMLSNTDASQLSEFEETFTFIRKCENYLNKYETVSNESTGVLRLNCNESPKEHEFDLLFSKACSHYAITGSDVNTVDLHIITLIVLMWIQKYRLVLDDRAKKTKPMQHIVLAGRMERSSAIWLMRDRLLISAKRETHPVDAEAFHIFLANDLLITLLDFGFHYEREICDLVSENINLAINICAVREMDSWYPERVLTYLKMVSIYDSALTNELYTKLRKARYFQTDARYRAKFKELYYAGYKKQTTN